MKKAIVFGGSGFIGSHVADVLTEKGIQVTIFDRSESPFLGENQEIVVGDILDEKLIFQTVEGADYVFNFAGIADIDECAEKPIEAIRYNILGNSIILEASRKAEVKRFVFASSAYVYSKAGAIYKNTKQACELLIDTYQQQFGLDYTIVRYGSLYGPRSNRHNSIYKLIEDAVTKKRIDYHGTGDEVREYIHVWDAAQLTYQILQEEYKNQHIVLTGQLVLRYEDLLNMINEMLNNQVAINYLPKTSATHYTITPYNFSPKTGRKLLNNPYIDMGQGLLEMMEIIHEKHHKNNS